MSTTGGIGSGRSGMASPSLGGSSPQAHHHRSLLARSGSFDEADEEKKMFDNMTSARSPSAGTTPMMDSSNGSGDGDGGGDGSGILVVKYGVCCSDCRAGTQAG